MTRLRKIRSGNRLLNEEDDSPPFFLVMSMDPKIWSVINEMASELGGDVQFYETFIQMMSDNDIKKILGRMIKNNMVHTNNRYNEKDW